MQWEWEDQIEDLKEKIANLHADVFAHKERADLVERMLEKAEARHTDRLGHIDRLEQALARAKSYLPPEGQEDVERVLGR